MTASNSDDDPTSHSAGVDPRSEAAGRLPDTKGSDTKGSDTKGSDAKGSDAKGSDAKGSDTEELGAPRPEADRDAEDAVETAAQRLHARLQRIAIAPPDPQNGASEETPEHASDSSGDSPASNGLAKLVLTLVQLLHEVLERQAVRRMEEETLTDDEVERVGRALMAQAEEIERLCEAFGLDPSDLDIPLGAIHVDEP